MKRYSAWLGILFILAVTLSFVGCFGGSSNPVTTEKVADSTLTNVRLVIGGTDAVGNLRAVTTGTPEVLVELKAINFGNTTNPIYTFRKKATVDGATATVELTSIPAKPAVAKLFISGGYILDGGAKIATWTGALDLAAGTTNTITLVAEGDQSETDVTVNVIDKVIATPANVATLTSDLVAKVRTAVNGITDYSQALTAFTGSNPGTVPQPADAEFDVPTGLVSVAYPKKDASTQLSISSFNSDSEVYLALINRGSTSLSPTWSASLSTSGSVRANRVVAKSKVLSPLTKEQSFHLNLRNAERRMPAVTSGYTLFRPSLRADSVGETVLFNYLDDSNTDQTLTAECMSVVPISGTSPTKYVYFYLDTADKTNSSVSQIITGLANNWQSVYETDRQIFGAEPTGAWNGVSDLTHFTILLSSEISSAGYFYSGDFYTSAVADSNNFKSNERKMFYLMYPDESADGFNVNDEIQSLTSTMAHEFQHMIYFYQKKLQGVDQDTTAWLNEAMSGYAEYINGFRIENGKSQSKALQTQQFFESFQNVSLTTWQGSHENYGEVFLFGTWLAQNYGNSGSVQSLVGSNQVGQAAVAAFTGDTFDKVFAKFMLALWINDYTNGGTYGIKDLDLRGTHSFGAGLADVTLTGPAHVSYSSWASTGNGTIPVVSYSAGFVKLTGGNGNTLTVNASLPSGVSLFELKKN